VSSGWRLDPGITEGAADEIASLRDRLVELARRGCCVVGVASRERAASGKSRVAARLATSLAADGRWRVLLMETNFDYPAVHDVLDIDVPHAFGFSQQMRARIRTGEPRPWTVVECTPNFHVLPEGVLRSPGILLTRAFPQAVQELRRSYDFIVADGPVVGAGSDHKALDAVIDTLVFAAGPGEPLEDAAGQISRWFTNKDLVAAVPVPAAP